MSKKVLHNHTTVAIIGAGRVGTYFSFQFERHHYTITAVISQSLRTAKRAAKFCRSSIASTNLFDIPPNTRLYFITTPDSEIPKVAQKLVKLSEDWTDRIVFHSSGAVSRDALYPLAQKGADTVVIHPLQTFSGRMIDLSKIEPFIFDVECDSRIRSKIRKIARLLGGKEVVFINPDQKVLYHLAGTIASNFVVILYAVTENILNDLDLNYLTVKDAIIPLMQGALNNLKINPSAIAMTGPVQRGDIETVKSHISELKKNYPSLLPFYIEMSVQILELVKQSKSQNQEQIKKIAKILDQVRSAY